MDASSSELARRTRQQEAVADLGQRALETDDVGQLLHDAAAAVTDTLDTDYCYVLDLLPEGEAAVLRAGVGWSDGLVGSATVPTDMNSEAGYALVSQQPVVVENFEFEQRFSGSDLVADHDVTSSTAVVVGPDEEPWGVLGVHATDQRAFTEHDTNFLRSVANVLASATENERAERRFGAVFDDPNILVALLDPDGTVRDINQTAMEYIDADIDAVVGEPFWETPWWGEGDGGERPAGSRASADDHRESAGVRSDVREWTERAADGEYVEFEVDLTRAGGQRYVINGVFRPVTNDDGDVVSVIVSDRDVTERREYERKLAESEQRYRALAENFPNGVVTLFDHDLRYTLAAGQAFERFPVSPGEVEGQTPPDVWGEDVAGELEPLLRDALDGESGAVELSYVDREWVVYAVPIADADGDVFAGMTMAQDVTEQAERERQLERYETIVETVNDGVYVVDGAGDFAMVNDAYAEMLGYAPEELVGTHASEVVVDGDRMVERVEELHTETADGRVETPSMEAELWTASGERLPVEATFTRLTEDDDSEWNRVGVVRDVSERKERERELEESEQRYRTLAENFPNGAVGLFDEDLRYTIVGGDILQDVDVVTEEIVGQTVWERYPDEVASQLEPNFRAAIEDGEQNEFELAFHDRHWRVHTLPVRDDDEVIAGMMMAQDITEQQEQERQLRDAKSRFEAATEAGAVGTWEWHIPEDRFVTGGAFARKFGVDPDAAREGVPLSRLVSSIYEDDRERVERKIEEAVESCGEYEAEYRVWNADDELRWVVARGHVKCDEDGNPVTFPGALTDITERREVQRELRESERRYRTLAENFPNGAVSVFDEDLRFTLAQGAVLGDTLPDSEAIQGQTVRDVFPDDIVVDIEPLLRAAFEEGETGSEMFEFADRHWRVWATPLRNADGDVFAGLSFAQDVTDQVEREQELERALDLLDKTERIADVGGWEIDTETMEVFWTEHIFDLLDVDADEEPALDEALDMYHEEDRVVIENAIGRALDSGESFDEEVRIYTESGEPRWLRLQGVPEVVDGEVVTLRGTAQDVTDQVEREQRLEDLVGKLEESNERLEQFAYAASHDLQEPLRMVSSYLQLVERRYADDLDADGREYIEFAVDGADRMRDMIQGLLEYSRVDSRGNPLEPVDLEAVFADVLDDLQVRIEETDAEIAHESLPTVDGDAGQLRQLFQNLLDNAIEYSGEGSPRVDITADREGDEWVVSVRDEGIGIDPGDADRVFEVFQSLHTQEEHSGTGIGLALCERIVERHGGDIWVDSAPGEGTTFTFMLPAKGEYSE